MKCYTFIVFKLLFILHPITVKCVSDVPAFLWNIKGHGLHIKPVSAFEVSTKTIMNNFLKERLSEKSTTMLVFLTDELSLEDFSPESPVSPNKDLQVLEEFLDNHPYMLLPHVRDPLKRLHNVYCEKEEFYLDKIDENMLQTVSSAVDRSCVVILHLPNPKVTARTGKTQVDAAKDILSSLSTSKKNVIGMYTASKSSWSSSENQHKSRSLLAQGDKPAGAFFNFENCTIMYATNITVRNMSSPDTVVVPLTNFELGGKCSTNGSNSEIEIKFPDVKQYSTFIIRMQFKNKTGVWLLTSSDVTLQNQKETEHTEDTEPSYVIEAPLGFSYSCGTLTFQTTNSTTKYAITIEGFQIQPFGVEKEAFAESFDCVPFFTLPIWMGLIVGILFIVILNTGVYALFAVKTMDRFDDPKGKTISVAFSAD